MVAMRLIYILKFLISFSLYFSSLDYAFCSATEGNFLSRISSLPERNKHLVNHEITENKNNIFNVLKYGAKGDGTTSDTQAFKLAWEVACKTKGGVMLVPSGFTFLLQPVTFDGSYCQPNVIVQVDGKIVAPHKLDWVEYDPQWILFKGAKKGIIIQGEGVIDGCGASWWESDDGSVSRPHGFRIGNSANVTVTGIRVQNTPKMHLFINNCSNVHVYNFTVSSPGDSPNTDGIHVSGVQQVDIHNATLACGDDCVSIQDGSSGVNIYDVECGPGHGYSIGGLGPAKHEAHVSNVTVFNSTVRDSLNGVRIKTWPGAYGSVKNVHFTNVTMSYVKIPIVIDQYYCGGHRKCPIPDRNAVAVSNVTFTNIKGTYSYKPVSIACSDFVPCVNITLAGIQITPTPERAKQGEVKPYCSNAYGRVLTETTPPLEDCLSTPADSGVPTEAPEPAPESPEPAPESPAPEPEAPAKGRGFWLW